MDDTSSVSSDHSVASNTSSISNVSTTSTVSATTKANKDQASENCLTVEVGVWYFANFETKVTQVNSSPVHPHPSIFLCVLILFRFLRA